METKKLEEVAIIINPVKDNLAVATVEHLDPGTELAHAGERVTLSGRVVRGQSFALRKIPHGQPFITLGDPIGLAACDVEPGNPIDEHNLEDRLPRLRVKYRDNPQRQPLDPQLASLTFDGYVRADGSVGARNYVGIVTSGMCSSTEVREV
ncbi:MAG: UxaA family hydrolase, partial [Acidobacteriia bacterium]|nr:UxaA family hydrolase [Terriglobia bacterium]